jgi:hypothetical protein
VSGRARLRLAASAVAGILLVAVPRAAQERPGPGRFRGEPTAGAVAADDAGIAAIARRVSAARLSAGIGELESFQTRDATTAASIAAANFLYDSFIRLGLDTTREDFTFAAEVDGVRATGIPASNVVATIPGTVSPEQILIVGAHYDSWSRGGTARTFAPGADDNASGTAAVVEVARVLAGRRFDFTVRVVAFGAEEYGLHGSRFHAQAARARGERIIGVLNLDMIGYVDRPPEDLDLVVNAASQWLARRFADAAAAYAPLPTAPLLDPTERASDHAPFWDAGYSALLAIEDRVVTNPYYHRTTDTIETLDLAFAAAVTRATTAAAAELAQPSRDPAPPTGLRVESLSVRSPFARVLISRLSWSAPAGGARGYHVYRSATSHLQYRRLTADALRTTSFDDWITERPDERYYYVVTAVDGSGAESNPSAEVSSDDAGAR